MDPWPQVVTNARGERLTFERTTRDTAGEALEVEVRYVAADAPPPLHLHPAQDERFEVRSGALEVTLAGDRLLYGAGEAFTVPAGTVHTMRAVGDDGAVLGWRITPALDTEGFFRRMWALQRVSANGRADPFRLAQILFAHRREFRLARPPDAVQWLAFGLLALIGRALGRR